MKKTIMTDGGACLNTTEISKYVLLVGKVYDPIHVSVNIRDKEARYAWESIPRTANFQTKVISGVTYYLLSIDVRNTLKKSPFTPGDLIVVEVTVTNDEDPQNPENSEEPVVVGP